MELKKIGILSLAKMAGIFGVISGLLLGVLSMIYTRILINKLPELAQQFNIQQPTGISSVLLLMILYGIIYFIAGIVLAFIYNLLASWVGGVKLEFKEPKEPREAAKKK